MILLVTDIVIAHCLTMIIMFSMYLKGIERLNGCVCEFRSVYACGLIIWGFNHLAITLILVLVFYSSFLSWVELN